MGPQNRLPISQMAAVSIGDLVASRPFMIVFLSFDIHRRPYNALSNPGVGIATITMREEYSMQSRILHSVLLQRRM